MHKVAELDHYLGSRSVLVRTSSNEEAPASYAVAVRSAFDALVGTAAQMSAALLAATAGLRDKSSAEALICSAYSLHAEAVDLLRAVHVPPNAKHFHQHIEHAAQLIGLAVSSTRNTGVQRGVEAGKPLAQLRRGWSELNRATAALPGLSVLNLGHCCGANPSLHEIGWLVKR